MLTRCSTPLFRSLALAVSLFLALPPGWCCSALAVFVPASDAATEVPCCCCNSSPETPAKSPVHAPAEPCSSPCCERLPTLLVDPHAGVPELAVPVVVAIVDFPPPLLVEIPVDFAPREDSSPPLRILLCSWLC